MREQIKAKVRATRPPWLDAARRLFTHAVQDAYDQMTAVETKVAAAAAGNA